MAEFGHTVRLGAEEVQQAILELAFKKASARGADVDAHTFHTKAAVEVQAAVPGASVAIAGAVVSWSDE